MARKKTQKAVNPNQQRREEKRAAGQSRPGQERPRQAERSEERHERSEERHEREHRS